MANIKKYVAEMIGTFVLVFVACGIAVWSNVDIVATALGFGLVIVAMAYSIGNVSGCQINPAVSLAMFIRKQLTLKDFLFYVLAQVLGATFGALVLGLVMRADFTSLGGNTIQPLLQANVVTGELDAQSYIGAFVVELVLTFIFVLAIIGVTDKKHHEGHQAGLVIGGALTLVHLLGLGFTGTSVNPARSFGPALIQALLGQDTTSLSQIWIWILAPLAGGALAALVYGLITSKKAEVVEK